MNDPKSPQSGFRPGTPVASKPVVPEARPASPGANPGRPGAPAPASGERGPTGKVRHDERGNAVWDWLAQTSRVCIDATSRLLKKLETPELKIEGKKDEELRIMPDPTTGGGYDPYNQATKPPKPGRK